MRSPTLIQRRLGAIERLPQPSAFGPTVMRDPKGMTSLDIHDRISELKARARWRRLTYCPPFPSGNPSATEIVARIAELRAKAAQLGGTRPPRRAPPPTDERE